MIRLTRYLLTLTLICLASTAFSEPRWQGPPLWQGQGRIAMSSDGNDHDHDDWGATALSLAILAAQGLQQDLVLYTYSDHVWSNRKESDVRYGRNFYEHMEESAVGAKERFGFDNATFIAAVDDPEAAYNAMAEAVNASSEDDPLFIIAAGPMQVVGEGIARADRSKLAYVTMISHSGWNNNHADRPDKWESHSGWTWKEIGEATEGTGLKLIKIHDQNGAKDWEGYNAPKTSWAWLETSQAREREIFREGNWDWLVGRIKVSAKKENYDVSDAGMVVWFLTGKQKASMKDLEALLEGKKVTAN
ncbi:MAG: hypothetical protein AAGF10_03390 [Verrucomicrobiota bacterium]